MTTPNPQVRRATIEDLPQLVSLWQEESLPWERLEKRFKEFQVVEAPGGEVLGALGLEIVGVEALLHSEVFLHPEQSDTLRALLWERAQVLGKNHGLVRVWTQLATPFWNHTVFQPATGEVVTKLPPAFGGVAEPWRFIQLKEESTAPISIDKEFAAFKELEKENRDKLFRQAKIMKVVAAFVILIVFLLVLLLIFKWTGARHQLPR